MFKKIAVAIITPTHTKKSFDMGLVLAKKLDSDLSVIECVYKNPPKFCFFETKSDKKNVEKQIKTGILLINPIPASNAHSA